MYAINNIDFTDF